jgi:predicted dehydrogenase/threonine dehydrogenase-like Zn-dependent dehydrogenase
LGYACAGVVILVGNAIKEFATGDRVACAGVGHACHAEINCVPRNLTVPIPRTPQGEWLPYEEAAFATLGAIALHGVRLGEPRIGEHVVVIGLGLIGLLTVQILRANGCAVLGIDPNEKRRDLAADLGATTAVHPDVAVDRVHTVTVARGADLVVVTAAAADSAPIVLAGEVARDRARIVAVGATGLDVPRRVFYEKELSLVVSRSYGPGRYDPNFEERGEDYPIGYVRWTERENMRAFLELAADGRVRVAPLITHRVPIGEADRAYELLADPSALGIVLQYPEGHATESEERARPRIDLRARQAPSSGRIGISIIGAGNFAQTVLLPALQRVPDVRRRGVVTATGLTARSVGDRFGFDFCATEAAEVWKDPETDVVVVATRNHLHAPLVVDALRQGKPIFVEKPLAVSEDQLADVVNAFDRAAGAGQAPCVMVGFNRRFSPMVREVKQFLSGVSGPLSIHYRVNAGALPPGSWVSDPDQGGGRIVSEVCHFVDLVAFLADAAPTNIFAQRGHHSDDVAISLGFANGSLASIGYYCEGDRAFSKERIEIFGGGAVAIIDDFRRGWTVMGGRRRRLGNWWGNPRKGHREELEAFLEAVRQDARSPIPFEESVQTTRATLAIVESLRRGGAVTLGY